MAGRQRRLKQKGKALKPVVRTPGSDEQPSSFSQLWAKAKETLSVSGLVQGLIRGQLNKLIKEGRLAFLGNDKVSYTDKNGKLRTLTFDGMVNAIADNWQAASGKVGGRELESFGVSHDDVKKLIIEEYHKSRAYTGGLKA